MTVGGIFFSPPIASRNQRSGDGSNCAAAGEKSLQKHRTNAKPGVQNLRARHMAKILVGDLVGQHSAQLVVVCSLQKARGHQKLAPAGIAGIDLGLVHYTDPHFL
jgi:hypothetical protein